MKPILVLLLLVPLAYSLEIDLSVNTLFETELVHFSHNNASSANFFDVEILNSGSLSYISQVRIDVVKDNKTVFTGWSDKKTLNPGNNGFFRIYWIPEEGYHTARVRIYYGGEFLENEINITAGMYDNTEDSFSIKDVKVFDNFIFIGITSSVDIEKAVVVPDDYPEGWSVLQTEMSNLKRNQYKKILLPYNSPSKSSRDIVLTLASVDGSYITKSTITIEKDSGFDSFLVNFILNALRG